MSDEIVRQSDPMKELFFSFLPMVKLSRGHRFHSSKLGTGERQRLLSGEVKCWEGENESE